MGYWEGWPLVVRRGGSLATVRITLSALRGLRSATLTRGLTQKVEVDGRQLCCMKTIVLGKKGV